ncbi:MAG: nucleotidyl transferase AbiEii/AbiGii toxin family protein [Chlamydiales bacterium]|nr:nucleotidyl transferase AbiEii/AbiGii toxin family protein [Chlamydiales bacterium]
MIDKLEVLQLAKNAGLQNSTIEKDYVLGWVLIGLQNNSKIGDSWIFKGGTCLKKCFFDEYRFSEDLDFTLIDLAQMNESFLMSVLKELAEWAYDETGIEIPLKSFSVEFYTNLQGSLSAQTKFSYIGPLKQKKTNSLPTIKLDLTPHEKVVLIPERREIFHHYSDKPLNSPKAFCYCYEEIFAEKLRALAERARPRDLYDIIHLYQERQRLGEKSKFFESLEQKCSFKKMPLPSLETIERHPQKAILSSEWENMLSHQLPMLRPFENFWEQLPHIFNWVYEDYPKAFLTQLNSFLTQKKAWTCIVLICENDLTFPYQERYFVSIPSEEIIRLNQSSKVWCQPLNLIDVTIKGNAQFIHDKLYEAIVMYLDEQTKAFVSHDSQAKNQKAISLAEVRPGDVVEVPGYFLNDWNKRINPSSGYVHYWFQPTIVLPPHMKMKLIQAARRKRF